jgi:hypothetical protein
MVLNNKKRRITTMPKKKKMSLSPIKVQSFVTKLEEKQKNKVKGGDTYDCDSVGIPCFSRGIPCIPTRLQNTCQNTCELVCI